MNTLRDRLKRTTIKDIARIAGVNPSTVTRALQGSDRVKPATRERITALATQLGYVPSVAAQTLVNRRSSLIGVVIPDMTNPFFAELGKGIEDEAAKHDLRVLIHDTRGMEAAERDAITLFLGLKVDGLIIPSARCTHEYYAAFDAAVPVVHVNRAESPDAVTVDTVLGSSLVMAHLLGLGHRRIGFVRGPAGPGREPKMFAYRQALEDAGLAYQPELIFSFDGTPPSSQQIVADLMRLDRLPTAVFAWNDVSAIALIHALREQGIDVPGKLSVVGHDDIQLAAYVDPPLTTVAWPMYALGQVSVRHLYARLQGEQPCPVVLPRPKLIVRESTAAPALQ